MSLGRVSITFIAAYKYSYNQQYAKNGGFLQKKFGDDVIFFANRVVFDYTASMAMTFKMTSLQILSFSRIRFKQIVSCRENKIYKLLTINYLDLIK